MGIFTFVLLAFWYIFLAIGASVFTAFVTLKMWRYMAEVNVPRNGAIAIEVATLVLVGISLVPVLWWFITFAYAPAFVVWMVGTIRQVQWEAARVREKARGGAGLPHRPARVDAGRRPAAEPRAPSPSRGVARAGQPGKKAAVEDYTAVRLQLLGMMKASSDGLELADASKILHVSRDRVRALIYELIGMGKLEGSFTSKDVFIPRRGIEDAITSNDEYFANWDDAAKKKDGKLDG